MLLERPLHLEQVDGHPFLGREHLRRQDGQPREGERSGDPRKQSRPVVRDHGQAVRPRSGPRFGLGADVERTGRRLHQVEVADGPLRQHGEQVAARHRLQEPVGGGRILPGQQPTDDGGALRQPHRRLLAHVAALQHVLHLGHQVVHQRRPPRRPRVWSGGGGVGHGEQVESREPLGVTDSGGHVQDQVLVLEVAASRGVDEQEVLLHEELDQAPSGLVDADAIEDGGGHVRADGHPHSLTDHAVKILAGFFRVRGTFGQRRLFGGDFGFRDQGHGHQRAARNDSPAVRRPRVEGQSEGRGERCRP